MSPEQGTGDVVDARSDVYAMGVVLYELVTGEWPFAAESQVEMFRMHLLEAPPPMASKREHLVVLPELEAIIKKALAKKKADRWADAGEMLRAIEALPAQVAWLDPSGRSRPSAMTIPTPPAVSPPAAVQAQPLGEPTTSPSRVALIAGLLGLFVVALLMGAGVLFYFLR